MSPVSPRLRRSLDALEDQVRAAEKALRKMPGAFGASLLVDEESENGEQAYLEFHRNNGGPALVVVYYNGRDTVEHVRTLCELPVDQLKPIAAEIPSFVALASAGEEQLADEIDEITAAIERALAAPDSDWGDYDASLSAPTTAMSDDELEQCLKTTGKAKFVERFPVLNNPTLSTEDAIQLLIADRQEKNAAEDETKSMNCARTMVSTGRRIIKAGRGEDALRSIAISKNVDINARQTARLILRQLEQSNR